MKWNRFQFLRALIHREVRVRWADNTWMSFSCDPQLSRLLRDLMILAWFLLDVSVSTKKIKKQETWVCSKSQSHSKMIKMTKNYLQLNLNDSVAAFISKFVYKMWIHWPLFSYSMRSISKSTSHEPKIFNKFNVLAKNWIISII